MENLAYIYVAQAYASPGETIPCPDGAGMGRFLPELKQNRLSSLASVRWLSIGLSLWIFNFAEQAIAGLGRNYSGPPVGCVQGVLRREGYYNGPIDNFVGLETEKAIRKYERDRSGELDGDGMLKNDTIAKMGCRPGSTEPSPPPRVIQQFSPPTVPTSNPEPSPRPRAVPLSNPTFSAPSGAQLALGCDSEAVTRLQIALRARGYFEGPITGYYGPLTRAAVMRFQRDYRLTVDGIAGPRTMAAMQGSVTPTQVTRSI